MRKNEIQCRTIQAALSLPCYLVAKSRGILHLPVNRFALVVVNAEEIQFPRVVSNVLLIFILSSFHITTIYKYFYLFFKYFYLCLPCK